MVTLQSMPLVLKSGRNIPGVRIRPVETMCTYDVMASDVVLFTRQALEKLSLNDASLSYQPETSQALGFGFRCGFLGLLHMEIVQERLEREYGLDLLFTSPSVQYEVLTTKGEVLMVDSPAKLPPPARY